MPKVVSLDGGPIVVEGMPLGPDERPLLTRPWTSTAFDDAGLHYRELEFRSLRNIRDLSRIRRITAHRTGISLADSPQQFSVFIPAGADPICFWRVPVGHGASNEGPLLCLGWQLSVGLMGLWITEQGDVAMLDRDIADLE